MVACDLRSSSTDGRPCVSTERSRTWWMGSKDRNHQPAAIWRVSAMNPSIEESMIKAAWLQLSARSEDALAELCRARDSGHRSAKLFGAIGHLQFELNQFEAAARTYDDAAAKDESD